MRATRDLIMGASAGAPFAVPALDGTEVTIRPLRSAEAEEVQAATVAGINMTSNLDLTGAGGTPRVGQARPRGMRVRSGLLAGGMADAKMSLDLAGITSGQHRSWRLAAHYGLVDPAMSLSDVEKAPADVVAQIGVEVMRRSGLGAEDALRQFRDLAGGSDDPEPSDGGLPASPDAG